LAQRLGENNPTRFIQGDLGSHTGMIQWVEPPINGIS